MLGKFNYHGTCNIHWIAPFLAILLAFGLVSCTTTTEVNDEATSSDNEEIQVGEPSVEIDSGEPRLEDLPVSPEQHEVEFKASAPEQYTVVPGDTLWDISNRFLVQPWYWPEIWYHNPQVQNPHLIYPGDVLTIFYVGGKPYLTVGGGPRVTKLSPRVRSADIDAQTYGIPIPAIQQFIIRPRVVSEETLDTAPYILSSVDERLAFGAGDHVYVRGFDENPQEQYTVFRKGEALYDPESEELLGFEAIVVGDGEIIRVDDPATLNLTQLNVKHYVVIVYYPLTLVKLIRSLCLMHHLQIHMDM